MIYSSGITLPACDGGARIMIALQPNGERIRFERWTVEAYVRGELTDPLVIGSLSSAVRVYPAFHVQVEWTAE